MNSAERQAAKLKLEMRGIAAQLARASAAGDSALEQALRDRLDEIEQELRAIANDVAAVQDDVKQLDVRVTAMSHRQVSGGGGGPGVVVQAPVGPVSINGYFPMGWA